MTSQQRKALESANAKRVAVADLKREVRDGKSLREALADERAQNVIVWALLKAKSKFGPTTLIDISSMLSRRRVSLSYHARVGTMTDRQNLALLEAVAEFEPKQREVRRRERKRKDAPKVPAARPELAAMAQEAISAVANPPARCVSCRTRLVAPSETGACGFCEAELSSVGRALEGRT